VIAIRNLTVKELESIKGGEGFTIWMGLGIAALIIFLSGVIEGITNPEACK